MSKFFSLFNLQNFHSQSFNFEDMSQASQEDNDGGDLLSPESPMTPDGMILARMPWHPGKTTACEQENLICIFNPLPGLIGNWNTVKSVSCSMLNGDEVCM